MDQTIFIQISKNNFGLIKGHLVDDPFATFGLDLV